MEVNALRRSSPSGRLDPRWLVARLFLMLVVVVSSVVMTGTILLDSMTRSPLEGSGTARFV